jgi:integrating conjugative element protein (TIGR03765 family)
MRATLPAWLLVALWALDVRAAESNPRTPDSRLTVVADLGGASALPYYRALNLLPSSTTPAASLPPPKVPHSKNEEAAFLPVHSIRLTPGSVPHQLIRAPGLTPFFLAGDDPRSRAWIKAHLAPLRQLGAVGFIVHVDSADALAALRALAPGLTLVPASADDLAVRLHLAHYPALVTATGIEQ